MKIIDISPMVSEQTAVWPGDISLSRRIQCQLKDGDSVDLSSLETTVHIGAHADAPCHYLADGAGIEQVDLAPYWGVCQVVDVSASKPLIGVEAVDLIANDVSRVLFKTGSFPDPQKFNQDFVAFCPQLIEALGKRAVQLVGIDTPSVDLFDSKDLPSHRKLADYKIRNLEGLVLNSVEPGKYELVALPLPLRGFDASPVRAALRTLS